MMKRFLLIFLVFLSPAYGTELSVPMYDVSNGDKPQLVGHIVISETQYGLLFKPDLKNLSVGLHGFHIHENPSCANKGLAAGGHLDPLKTNQHLGPYNDKGHLGDLPALYVDTNGLADTPVLAPKLHQLREVQHHSLMIHLGGDNYSDNPKLGGGGMRMVCGVIP